MAEQNPLFPKIDQGDPSNISRPVRGSAAKDFEANIRKPNQGVELPKGMVPIERAPGSDFMNNPFGSIQDSPEIIGTDGWLQG